MEKSFLIRKEELGFIIAALEIYAEDWEASAGEVNDAYDKDLATIKELLADLRSEYENY